MRERIIIRWLVMTILVIAGVTSCMTLPNVAQDQALPHSSRVEFEGSHGSVSYAHGRRIIESLERAGISMQVLERHLAYEQSVDVENPLVLGNSVTLLQNGPLTYAAMLSAISAATDHINLETFIFGGEEVGQRFADALLERSAAGVKVNVIHDSVGSLLTPTSFFDRLREGGVSVIEFNPVNPFARGGRGWRLNNRDHRRQLVIDGRIAFTGGVNISDSYLSAPSRKRTRKHHARLEGDESGWRDTHIRVEGPVVAEFQRLFIDTWERQTGAPPDSSHYFPALEPAGEMIVRVIGSRSIDDFSPIYLTLMSAISHAEINIHMTIAYFAPDAQLIDALLDAAARGVDVVLILPSHTDSWAVFHLGRSYYTTLLKGGVRIFERLGGLMHAKSVSIDGVWTTIGSTNMDWRSFLHNDEMNAVILNSGFAGQMDTMFNDDLSESSETHLEQWRRRSLLMRLKERFARLGAYWL